jgi:methyl-CpG-binding domain protein 4
MIPKHSPFGLLQESLWPNEWLILVSCMLLNCTSRKQVEQVLPTFISRYPTPGVFLKSDVHDVEVLCKPLGFARRRTQNLFKMTQKYVEGSWQHARELPGIGDYAARAWEIFCQNKLGDEPPKDHALVRYWNWRCVKSDKNVGVFVGDTEVRWVS